MARNLDKFNDGHFQLFCVVAQLHCLAIQLQNADESETPSNETLGNAIHGIAITLERAYNDLAEV